MYSIPSNQQPVNSNQQSTSAGSIERAVVTIYRAPAPWREILWLLTGEGLPIVIDRDPESDVVVCIVDFLILLIFG